MWPLLLGAGNIHPLGLPALTWRASWMQRTRGVIGRWRDRVRMPDVKEPQAALCPISSFVRCAGHPAFSEGHRRFFPNAVRSISNTIDSAGESPHSHCVTEGIR